MKLIDDLKWRYATKKFDKSKKISNNDFDKLKEVIRLSATSFGLQYFKVLNIQEESTRKALKQVSFEQSQITDASHLLVFGHYADINDKDVDNFIKYIAKIRKQKTEDLHEYSQMMKGYINSRPSKNAWAARQIYLVLGTLMTKAAEMKIDTCPIEGFDESSYDEILHMDEKGLKTTVVIALGYRAEDDTYQHAKKVRRPIKELFEQVEVPLS
ncbi:MAG: NAD(P)H-dependent oxidoreductase, partial [Bacteroidales bacterium]|nr:NAD(P)H-dependent oxidoreductase [Bacteroidales bacterium]